MDLKEKVKKLPASPGVYLMKDSLNNIIYVGKSKNLKSRVGSYFQNSKHHSPKVLKLVGNLKDFDYILTDTEFEAFMLECKLIKEIKPAYNRKMKSPMSYGYIRININEKYPYIEVSNFYDKSDGSLYWGPYTSKNTLEKGIQGIKECCRILCSSSFKKASGCLNYSLGLCMGMCLEETPRRQYLEIFNKIINLLNGTDRSILEEMEHMMNCASEKFDFENAAKYRDYIGAVNYFINSSKVIEFTEANQNIALLEGLDEDTIKFFLIKGHRVLFTEKYSISCTGGLQKLVEVLRENILSCFKDTDDSIEVTSFEVDESHIIYNYLKNKNNSCRYVIIEKAWIENKSSWKIDAELNRLLTTE